MNKLKNREKDAIVTEKDVGLVEIKEPDLKKTTVYELFQFANSTDIVLIVIATICSLGNGISQPLLYLIFSDIIGAFAKHQATSDSENFSVAGLQLQSSVDSLCIKFLVIGLATFFMAYLQRALWLIIGERQAFKIRDQYYKSILSQDMGWFDSVSSGEVALRLAGDIDKIQDGISDKIGLLIQYMATCVGGFIIALVRGWKLTLVMMSIVPLLIGSGVVSGRIISESTSRSISSYGKAGAIAAEVLGGIRTVYSFNAVPREVDRYTKAIDSARAMGIKKALVTGASTGFVTGFMFLSYALAMWYGGQLIINGEYQAENVLVVFFNVLVGSMNLGQTAPSLAALSTAQGAASNILSVIYRKSRINPFTLTETMSKTQKSITPIKGEVKFKEVVFSYPNRQDKIVLKGVSFSVPVGKTVALVGSSGSGKSTTISLLERFYDPKSGTVLIDGIDIKELPVSFLRQNIGLVGQEPTLFATTIKNNLLLGLPDDINQDEAQAMIEKACKAANIHDFITQLPKGYDTLVGEKGGQLSGGQKQRIAIARAIVKNPPILLLDEATSALDTESERLVQRALESASENRTTIVIAHRLSTIQHADIVLVFDKGNIIEQGTHSELIEAGGFYSNLVAKQSIRSESIEPLKEGIGNHHTTTSTYNIKETMAEEENHDQEEEIKYIDDVGVIKMTTKAPSVLDPEELRQKKLAKKPIPALRVLALSKPWAGLLAIGTLGAFFDGSVFPIYSILLTRITQSFLDASTPGLETKGSTGINFWALMFVALSMVCFLSSFLKVGVLSMLGEHITFIIRKRCFEAMTQQEVAYYDDPANSLGTLTAKLSTEADQVQGLISKVYGAWVSALSCVVVGLALAFNSGWKLTLVVMACIPLTAFSQLYRLSSSFKDSTKTKMVYQKVSQIAMESVVQIRTLASLSKEGLFYSDYIKRIEVAHNLAVQGFLKNSIGYGITMGSPHFVNALAFWYGTTLVVSGEYKYQDMFQIITGVIFMGISIGMVSAEVGTLVKSKLASIEIFDLWDRKPAINSSLEHGDKSHKLHGNIDLKNAKFAYPTRSEVPILQGLDISILANKKVALVGSSGSGKSTIIALAQRFYELDSGSMEVEGHPISEWNVPHLRSGIAAVGQEPVLFNMSIEENIRYGAVDPESVSSDEINRVAKLANAHEFISMLPEGYKTNIGERGGQISGGQKQRIAIARALVRNPALLLLDEATSALDSQSEMEVQSALDKASENRTTITIAHRLSTVQNSDIILAMREGKLVESGTHDELLALKGYYYSLVNSQAL